LDDNGKGKTEYFNKDRKDQNGIPLAYDEGDVTSRWASCYDVKPPTLAVTLRFPNEYNEIQLCPWYLTLERGFRLKELASGQTVFSTLSKVFLPSPVDACVLMDKVIVHELTHTKQAFPSTIDLDLDNGPYGKITSFLCANLR